MTKSKFSIKKIAVMAMLCAVAFVVMYVLRIPVAFMTYEPKEVIVTIGGFMMGPLAAAAISIVVAFLEMITISDTGPIGMLMNVLAGCSFACTASYIYSKKHSMKGAIIGLSAGVIMMTVVMILWNYVVTPIFLNVPRQDVVALIIPLLLPFNLIKACLNMALVMLLYKPVVMALRKSGLMPSSKNTNQGKFNLGFFITGAVLLCTCVLLILALAGII